MSHWNTDKKIWAYIFGIALLVLAIINMDVVVNGFQILWNACSVLVFGSMVAYVLNLIMVRVENILPDTTKYKNIISLIIALLVFVLLIYALINLVVPSLIDAFRVLFETMPTYFEKLQKFLMELFENNPQFVDMIESIDVNWKSLFQSGVSILTNGMGSVLDKTLSIVNVVINVVVNGALSIILAIYILMEKERFIGWYHRFTNLVMKPEKKKALTDILKITHQTFSSFIGGQCVEAIILGTMCAVGMFILRMPYPVMIGTLVGVINIIPMIGAYVGGAIGMFIVFTVNPVTSIFFLIFLCVIQQIESNIFYPRVVGKSVGLPGIFVMVTVVVGGSLAGVSGMFLGIPLVASIYKIAGIYFRKAEIAKENKNAELETN